ncbi:MAG TPA: [protein-PII] uridylyltransferase [Ilumatobacter sp.]|nr:[protein-PII] uridylyltransferase [Ilumatobacter sp.]
MAHPAQSPAVALARRQEALADTSRRGVEYCRELAAATDAWVAALATEAAEQHRRAPRFALVAVGGYGRGELAPFSDIDVLLVHGGRAGRTGGLESVASAIWYPIWDAGLKLGHAVRTLDEQLDLAKTDLDTATALLTARPLAGDAGLVSQVIEAGQANWTKRKKRWLDELQARVRARQAGAGEVAYTLEPDLKDGHGGIRDVQSLWWAEAGGLALPDVDRAALAECYDTLLHARVALHLATGRPGETLRLEEQDAAAVQAGAADADALMAGVAAAARTVAWIADEAWGRVGRAKPGPSVEVSPGVLLVGDEVELAATADPAVDPTLPLDVATAAARRRARIGRHSLDRLAATVPQWPARWPVGAIDKLVALLLEGHAAIPVLEALDQRGLITRMLPEWEPNRSRPQRNAYHRFTVDRHLWEAAANAADLAHTVARPDLLVLGALLHDIGKGYPGDHTVVGMAMVAELGPRLGLNDHDVAVLVKLVEHHLLLPDAAVRRDVSDPRTIESVAEACGTYEVAELLHALTIADSAATGPAAWGRWKEELVADLAERVKHVLSGGDLAEATWTLFPGAETLALMADGAETYRGEGDRLVATYRDLPGAFARIAGVLALHGLDIVTARAHSDEHQAGRAPMGACEFRIEVPPHGVDWEPVESDLRRAMAGQLAIESRLAERARTYRRRRAQQAAPPGPARVLFLDEASSNATVLEVRCPDRVGMLYRIARAVAAIGLDVRHANVQTVGLDVVDTFYVRDWHNQLVTDPQHRAEIDRAITHAIAD